MAKTPAFRNAAGVAPARDLPHAQEALTVPCGEPPAPGSAKAVAPGVLWMPLPLTASAMTINSWAVRDGAGWAVVDTGMANEPAMAAWRALTAAAGALGGPPTRVFATHMHADHVGLAGWLTREHGCELWMTRSEYQQSRIMVADNGRPIPHEALDFFRRAGWPEDSLGHYRPLGSMTTELPQSYQRLQDGQQLRIGEHLWQVVVGNGHSLEHACLYCPQLRLLISGDQVLPTISSNVSVTPMEPHADPLAEWLASIAKLRRLIPDDVLVLPAHHEPFFGLHARLDRLARKRHDALHRLRGWIASQPRRTVDAFEPLFGRSQFTAPFTLQLATGEAVAYLNHLVQRGEASVTRDAEGRHWYRGRDASPLR